MRSGLLDNFGLHSSTPWKSVRDFIVPPFEVKSLNCKAKPLRNSKSLNKFQSELKIVAYLEYWIHNLLFWGQTREICKTFVGLRVVS
jgi:hypothetical protein